MDEAAKKTKKRFKTTYKPSFWSFVFSKLLFLLIGVSISVVLYWKCMFCQNCNPVVVAYFGIIGLTCFEVTGLPISKLSNLPKVL